MKNEFNLCTLGHNINKNRQLEKGEVECLQRKFQIVPFYRSSAFIPHFPFGAHAKLYLDCTFERIKSNNQKSHKKPTDLFKSQKKGVVLTKVNQDFLSFP